MTPFETIMIICAVLIVLLMCGGIYFILKGIEQVKTWEANIWNKLRSILGYNNDNFGEIKKALVNIGEDVALISRNTTESAQYLDDIHCTLDKMHRNICADVAEKMVDKAFPIKEGEPLDKPFDNPFIPSGATTWPPCYVGGPCTNPHRDCINCPNRGTGGSGSTNTSIKAKDAPLQERFNDNKEG